MSFYGDGYASFANYAYNIYNKNSFLKDIFNNAYLTVKDPNFLTKDFLDHLSDFPKFPNFFNIFSGQNYVKINNIYNASLDYVYFLPEMISDINILRYKHTFDLIPELVDEINRQAYIQYGYMTTLNQIYNSDFFLRSFSSTRSYQNYIDCLYSDRFKNVSEITDSSGLENSSLILSYSIQSAFYSFFNPSCSLTNDLSNSLDIDNETVKNDFNNFITNKKSEISLDLALLILKTIYGVPAPSVEIKESIAAIISDRLDPSDPSVDGLSEIFDRFMDQPTTIGPKIRVATTAFQTLYGSVSTDICTRIIKNPYIVTLSEDWNPEEDADYTSYINKIDINQLQPYLLLTYCYKFWFSKFLNVLLLSTRYYVQDIIKPSSEYTLDKFNEFEGRVNSIFNNYINYSVLKSFLEYYNFNLFEYVVFTHSGIEPYIELSIPMILSVGGRVQLTTTGTLPGGISLGTYYYLRPVDDTYTKYNLYNSKSAAEAGGPSGLVSIDGTGSGTHKLMTNYYHNIVDNYGISNFSAGLYGIELFGYDSTDYNVDNPQKSGFFGYSEYDDFITSLLEDVFNYIHGNAMVSYNFNWYDYHELVKIYLNVFIRNGTFNGECLPSIISDLDIKLKTLLTDGSTTLNLDELETFFRLMITKSKQPMFTFYNNMCLSVITREIGYGIISNFIS